MKVFYLALSAFLSIYIVIDLFEKIDNLVEAHLGAGDIFLYFLCKIPLIVVQGIPMAILMAGLISLGILARNNEIIALKASGINPLKCLAPIVLAAFGLTLLNFVLSQTLVPLGLIKSNSIWQKKRKRGIQSTAIAHGEIWWRSENIILNAGFFDGRNNILKKVSLFFFDKDFNLVRRVDANEARWSGEDWIFLKGIDQKKSTDTTWVANVFKARVLRVGIDPQDFQFVEKLPDEMTFGELYSYIGKVEKEGYDATFYRLKLHSKISFPCTGIVLAIMAVAIALLLGRHASIPMGVAMATALAFIYLVIFQLSISIGKTGALPAWSAAWIGNLTFCLVGILLLLRAPL